MKIVLSWAGAGVQNPHATAAASTLINRARRFMLTSFSVVVSSALGVAPESSQESLSIPSRPSIRERPHAKFLLGDLPESGEPVRLSDQEQDDEPAEHHQFEFFLKSHGHLDSQPVWHVREHDRGHDDES